MTAREVLALRLLRDRGAGHAQRRSWRIGSHVFHPGTINRLAGTGHVTIVPGRPTAVVMLTAAGDAYAATLPAAR